MNVSTSSSSVEYRTEAREVKARAELCAYRAVVDDLGFSPVLVNYAIESQQRELGKFSLQFVFQLLQRNCITVF